jgi:hypothetical protein
VKPTARELRELEAGFQDAILEAAQYAGWKLRYHTLIAIGSEAGFPDLVLIRPPRIVFAELKREGENLKPAQANWMEALWQLGAPIEGYVWRPSDWPAIERVLAREPAKAAR